MNRETVIGLIGELGTRALNKACAEMERLHGPTRAAEFRVALLDAASIEFDKLPQSDPINVDARAAWQRAKAALQPDTNG